MYRLFFQQEVVDAYMINIGRGRSSFEANNDLFLPFFLFSISLQIFGQVKYLFVSLLAIFLGVFSNNRTRFISVIFGLVTYLLVHVISRTKNSTKSTFIFLITSFTIVIALLISSSINSFSVFDRFTLEKANPDYVSQNFRIESLKQSALLAIQFPTTGVGLGNYYYYNLLKGVNYKYSTTAKNYEKKYHEQVNYSPHNVFAQALAETGITGFISLFVLLCYFIYHDLVLIFIRRKIEPLQYVIASWIVFISMFFNPPQTLFINGWFWFLRGILEAIYSERL